MAGCCEADASQSRHPEDPCLAARKGNVLGAGSGLTQVTGAQDRGFHDAVVAYMPQDNAAAFEDPVTVFDWMRARGKPRDDDQAIRATLGRLLFSRDEMLKTVDKLSGGERGRMLFGEIMLKRPNIILMDEPTNHLDMESIEALNLALENYPGTLIFVSHDREFVSSIATRVVEIKSTGIIDFRGTYDDYLRSRGIAIDLQRAASQ